MLKEKSLEEWHDDGIYLLDLRELAEQSYTFSSQLVVNIPWSQQKLRSPEYPSRSTRFALFCSRDKVHEQVDWFINAALHPTKQPWLVEYFVVDSPDALTTAKHLSLVLSSSVPKPFPYSRLWTPNTLMPRLLDNLKNADPYPTNSTVYDLGCGSCRDVMYLSEEARALELPLKFCGVDHNKSGAINTVAFAARRGVSDSFTFALQDLRKLDAMREMFYQDGNFVQCVYGCRYLHRDLILLVRDVLPIGAIFAWSHFAMPLDGIWKWQHPSKSSDILARDELKDLFSDGYDILLNVYEDDSDHGRPLNQFIARKTGQTYN